MFSHVFFHFFPWSCIHEIALSGLVLVVVVGQVWVLQMMLIGTNYIYSALIQHRWAILCKVFVAKMRIDISCQLLSACVHKFEICLRWLWRVAKNKAANFQHKLHPDVLHARCQCNYNYLKFMEGLRTDHSNTSSVRCSLEAAGAKEDGCGLIWFHSCGLTWFVDVCWLCWWFYGESSMWVPKLFGFDFSKVDLPEPGCRVSINCAMGLQA